MCTYSISSEACLCVCHAGTIQEEVLKTYSVHAVVDQRRRRKLPFHEAVAEGIIDPNTGEYVNNKTGEKLSAEEAIAKGMHWVVWI